MLYPPSASSSLLLNSHTDPTLALALPQEINRESFYVLEAFILKTGRVAVGPRMRDLEVLRKQLKAKIYEEATSNAKHPEILSISSDIVRLLHGLRLTCCKVR